MGARLHYNQLMNIVIGFTGLVISMLLLIYRVRIRGFMGQIGWAERYLGPGGTYTALLLFAVLLFFLSLTIMTGAFDWIFKGSLGSFFNSVKGK